MKAEQDIKKSATTEQKIKEAARKVFTEKGYAATRTRDIAEASGYNLALINYYFRSKENLFGIIMMESLQLFVGSIIPILNDETTTLQQKVETIVSRYIDMLIANPNVPIFVMTAVNNNPHELMQQLRQRNQMDQLYIEVQWAELMKKKKKPAYNPMHLFINMIALTVFPFIGAPMIKARNNISTEQYNELMLERKQLIPMWVKSMFESI